PRLAGRLVLLHQAACDLVRKLRQAVNTGHTATGHPVGVFTHGSRRSENHPANPTHVDTTSQHTRRSGDGHIPCPVVAVLATRPGTHLERGPGKYDLCVLQTLVPVHGPLY